MNLSFDELNQLLENQQLVPGETAYVISAHWLRNLKESLKDGRKGTPILNSPILDGDRLKPAISEYKDYEIITEQLWNRLVSEFGGGPPIPRDIEYDPNISKPVVLLRPITMIVYYRDLRRNFKFSPYKTIGELKNIVCQAFNCDPALSRLCDFENRIRQYAMEDSKTLSMYQITSSHQILLEVKVDEKTWVSVEHHEKLMSQSPSMTTINTSAAEPGVCGFTNLGNTCYFNAALQCIVHTTPLVNFFTETNWQSSIQVPGGVTEVFGLLMNDVWNGNNSQIAPRVLRRSIAEIAKHFGGNKQQDSHELLTYLLSILHEEMNVANGRPSEEVYGDGTNDQEIADLAWARHQSANKSIISDTMHGQFKARCICPNKDCRKTTTVFDPFLAISLPVPQPRESTPEFIFVPYDFNEPKIVTRVQIFKPPSVSETIEALQKAFSPARKFLIAQREPRSTTLQFMMTITATKPDNLIYVFELPEMNDEEICAPVRLLCKTNSKLGPIQEDLDSFFIVKLKNQRVSDAEIMEACKDKFNDIFTPTVLPILDDNLKSVVDRLAPTDFDGPIQAKLSKATLEERLIRDRHHQAMTGQRIDVLFSTPLLQEMKSFNWNMLRRVTNHDQETESHEATVDTKVSIEDCLDKFTKASFLDTQNRWLCPHCGERVCANRKMDIWRTSDVLIIHLKRFARSGTLIRKIDVDVDFPDVLDIGVYKCIPDDDKYKLYAVINHTGTINEGHYTAYAFHEPKKKWFFFNDGSAKPSRAKSAHTKNAYILFYRRMSKKEKK